MPEGGRVLLLSWTIPPQTTGSAVIVGNLARQFSRAEMVVAGERPWGRAPVVWDADWPELVYVIAGWPPGLRGARWWRWLQFPLLLLRTVRLVRERGCTAIVTVFPKEDFLLAGYLAARWTGAALFPYFHNTLVENRSGLRRRFAQWLQQRVFARADHIFVMSDGVVELFRERYPQLACSALPHAVSNGVHANGDAAEALDTPLRLVISGSINESCREATVRVCEAIEQAGDTALTVLSGTPAAYLRRIGVLRNGAQYDTVPPDRVLGRLREADIVVLAHGFHGALSAAEYRTIFPTKTIEYLISGRPILAHAPAGCFLSRFLTEHDCALLVTEPTTGALLDGIRRLRSDPALRARLVRNATRAAERFRGPHIAGLLRAQLRRN